MAYTVGSEDEKLLKITEISVRFTEDNNLASWGRGVAQERILLYFLTILIILKLSV